MKWSGSVKHTYWWGGFVALTGQCCWCWVLDCCLCGLFWCGSVVNWLQHSVVPLECHATYVSDKMPTWRLQQPESPWHTTKHHWLPDGAPLDVWVGRKFSALSLFVVCHLWDCPVVYQGIWNGCAFDRCWLPWGIMHSRHLAMMHLSRLGRLSPRGVDLRWTNNPGNGMHTALALVNAFKGPDVPFNIAIQLRVEGGGCDMDESHCAIKMENSLVLNGRLLLKTSARASSIVNISSNRAMTVGIPSNLASRRNGHLWK